MEDDIFSFAESHLRTDAGDQPNESYLLCVGSKSGGKSTIISTFLNPAKADDETKPTIGFEYSYGRRPNGGGSSMPSAGSALASIPPSLGAASASSSSSEAAGMVLQPAALRDIVHVWELGGNNSSTFSELVNIVLTSQRLPSNVMVVVCDLSRPASSLKSAAKWMALIKARCADLCEGGPGAGGSKGKAGAQSTSNSNSSGGETVMPHMCVQLAKARLRLGWAQRNGAPVFLPVVAAAETARKISTSQSISPISPAAKIAPSSNTSSSSSSNSSSVSAFSSSSTTTTSTVSHATPTKISPVEGPSISIVTPSMLPFLTSTIQEHPDARVLAPTLLPCQCILVGTKFDGLKDLPSSSHPSSSSSSNGGGANASHAAVDGAASAAPAGRRATLQAFRYLAHIYGAHALTVSTRDRTSIVHLRTLLSHVSFGTETRRAPIVPASLETASSSSALKQLYIPAGSDSIDAIGLPPSISGGGTPGLSGPSSTASTTRSDVDDPALSVDVRFERFLRPILQVFPLSSAAAQLEADTPVDLKGLPPTSASISSGTRAVFTDEASKHPEPLIDMLRASSAEETAAYVKEQERRLRLEAKAQQQQSLAASSSSGGTAATGKGEAVVAPSKA